MAQKLKQSTAFTFRIGPFLDDTDFKSSEGGLTINQADIQISKNGGAFAQTSDGSPTTTHDTDGWYQCPLTATDTDTLGTLDVQIVVAGALPVWRHFEVLTGDAYDALFSTSASMTISVPLSREGTATAGAAGSITLDASASTTAELFTGQIVAITGGTGAGQSRLITAYSTGREASVAPDWATNPDGTSEFAIVPAGRTVKIHDHTNIVSGSAGVDNPITVSSGAVSNVTTTATATSVTNVNGLTDSLTILSIDTPDTVFTINEDLEEDDQYKDATIKITDDDTGDICYRRVVSSLDKNDGSNPNQITIDSNPPWTLATDDTIQVVIPSMHVKTDTAAILDDTGTNGVAIADNAITAAKIATDAITAAKIEADAIGASELAADAATEIRDAITAATLSELTGIADAPATPTMAQAIMLLYMWLRNNTQATSTERRILNNAGTEIMDATMSDDGTTFQQGQLTAP